MGTCKKKKVKDSWCGIKREFSPTSISIFFLLQVLYSLVFFFSSHVAGVVVVSL